MFQYLIDNVVEAFSRSPVTRSAGRAQRALPTMPSVDLPRFMGVWYPIACIPQLAWQERACNSVETYQLSYDGSVKVQLNFRDGSYNGPLQTLRWTGFVRPGGGNAVWDLQPVWPFRVERRIVWIARDYTQAMVACGRCKYVCYLSRTPQVARDDYAQALSRMAVMGFDLARLRAVPRRALTS